MSGFLVNAQPWEIVHGVSYAYLLIRIIINNYCVFIIGFFLYLLYNILSKEVIEKLMVKTNEDEQKQTKCLFDIDTNLIVKKIHFWISKYITIKNK